jgi:hypothetical protein
MTARHLGEQLAHRVSCLYGKPSQVDKPFWNQLVGIESVTGEKSNDEIPKPLTAILFRSREDGLFRIQ